MKKSIVLLSKTDHSTTSLVPISQPPQKKQILSIPKITFKFQPNHQCYSRCLTKEKKQHVNQEKYTFSFDKLSNKTIHNKKINQLRVRPIELSSKLKSSSTFEGKTQFEKKDVFDQYKNSYSPSFHKNKQETVNAQEEKGTSFCFLFEQCLKKE